MPMALPGRPRDRELDVLAGLGYAGFRLVPTFAAELKRPKNAPPPEVAGESTESR